MTSPALPPYSGIVFDEAHNLEEAATRHFSVELSLPRLRFILRRLWRSSKGRRAGTGVLVGARRQVESGALGAGLRDAQRVLSLIDAATAAVEETEWAARPFFEQLEGKLCKRGSDERVEIDSSFLVQDDQADLRTALQTWNSAITALVSALESVGLQLVNRDADMLPFHMDFQQDIDAAVGGLNEIVRETAFVLEARDNAFVYWIEKVPMRQGGARGWAAPIAVGPRLAAEVYALKDTVVFSSATLAVGDSFDFIKSRLGIDLVERERLREVNVGTPFDYAEQCRIAVPTFLPEPDGKDADFAVLLAGFLSELFSRTRGRAMALFTSYAMLGRVADILIDNPLLTDYDILVQGRTGSRESIVECFKRDVTSILLGTHSFWEGVDLVGETLSCVVVARLPFAVYTEPLERARCGAIRAGGGDPFIEYSLPSAAIRLRQGFGRLIRHRSDRGIVIIADRRIATKTYGRILQRSLPVRTVRFSDSEQLLDAVDQFLAGYDY